LKAIAKRVKEVERSPFYTIADYARSLNIKDIIFLNVGEPDFTTPQHIIKAAKKALDEGFTHYSGDKGLLELRQLIAEKLRKERELEVDPAEGVIITSGGGEANWAALMSLINPGDEVLIPSPYYPPYNTTVRLAGGVPVPVPLKEELGFEWDPEDLERRITQNTKLIIVCSPDNPTGGVLSEKCIRELARAAQEHDLLVLSDEVYEAFLYDNKKFCSIASIPGMEERTIITNSFSKTYAMTGWRVGFIAGSSEIISNALKVHYATTICASTISQKAAIAALIGPQNCVKEMASEYDARRKIIVEGLNKIAGFKCNMPKGAFYVFPNIKEFKMSSEAFAKHLVKEARVVTVNGSAFGPDGEGYLRISYAASQKNILNALDRISEATEKLQ
jgi:aminotransferase